jgi:drug/metabolite transporter (DMT)-like permease
MTTFHRGLLYGLLAAAIWGGMYIVSDAVLRVVPPFTLLTIRLGLGIATLVGVRAYQRREKIFNTDAQRHRDAEKSSEFGVLSSRYAETNTTSIPQNPEPRTQNKDLLTLLLVGLVGYGISVGAQFVGTDLSNGVNGALITSASPAFILIFAALILRETLTWRRIAAVALASIGVVVILDLTQVDLSSAAFAGNVALVVAALTWGLFSVLSRRVGQGRDTLQVTLFGFIGGLLLTVPAAGVELQSRPIGNIDGLVLLGILYLGIISTALAMWLWTRAFTLVDASTASLCFFAQPLVGALLGALTGQPITAALVVGGVLIGVGVLLALR